MIRGLLKVKQLWVWVGLTGGLCTLAMPQIPLRLNLQLPLGLRTVRAKSQQASQLAVDNWQRDEIQNVLYKPSKIFWKLSSGFYKIIFCPLTFSRWFYTFSAGVHCLKCSKEHMLAWARVWLWVISKGYSL